MQEENRIILSLVLTLLLLLGCSVQEPVLPSWRVPVVVPLGTERFSFQEEIVDRNSIITRGDTLYISVTGEFDPRYVTEHDLRVPGRDTTLSVEIGILSLDSIETRRVDPITFTDILPEFTHLVGQSVVIPETTLTSHPKTVESEEFREVLLDRGEIKICFTNDLPMTLGPNGFSPDGMQIDVYDADGALVTNITIDDVVPAGGSYCEIKSITSGDGWIRQPLRLEYMIPIAEDTTFILTDEIIENSSCRLQVTLLDLEVREIVGRLDTQHFTRNLSIAMPNGDRIIAGMISTGSLELQFDNRTPIGAVLDIVMPDITEPEGPPLSEGVTLTPSGHAAAVIQLADFIIANSVSEGSPLDSLRVDIEVETEESGGFVHIRHSDYISVTVHIDEIVFSDLEGYLSSHSLRLGPYEENDVVDYEGISGGFSFRHGQLMIAFENELNVENLSLNINITGYHEADGGVLVDSATVAITDYRISTGTDSLLLSDGEVVALLNILPTDIVCTGSLGYSGYASVSAGQGIRGSYSIQTPIEIEIQDPEPVEFDPDTLQSSDIDETFRDAAGEDITSAVLRARIVNHSPLGGEVLLRVSADPPRVALHGATGSCTDSPGFAKTIDMDAASVDPATGFVENAAISLVEFPLSAGELSVFKYPPVVSALRIVLQETAGRVIVCGSDYIEVSGEVEFELLVQDKE